MAFTTPYALHLPGQPGVRLEFLHELIQTPLPREQTGPDGFYPPHAQDYCELIFFRSGSRLLRIGEQEMLFSAGDILAVRPDEVHRGHSLPCLLDRYYLHLSPDAMDALPGGRALLALFFDRPRYTGNRLRLPPEEQRQALELLDQIDSALRFSPAETRDLAAFIRILQLLLLLREAHSPEGTPRRSAFLLSILAFMENASDEQDLLSRVQQHFGISRSSLWRLFRQELQSTPAAYLQQLRLENARRLLLSGGSVTDTALASGFSDCSHFIQLFKARYGLTPLQYQKSQQKTNL